ncbi:MAG: hypothetical protein CL693_12925 [Cellvibrionaceae bacterium]|nr:hypothetical protein [Cellvibrionaceae bacterium]|tara:strand:- start:31313 stop:32500 length:1188 start_codon:yes stop_codon:yes gene_type:complete
MKAIHQYLERYAEAEAQELSQQLKLWPESARYKQVLVIPVYDESDEFIQRLRHSKLGQQTLLIAVVNRPDNISDCPANDVFLLKLSSTFEQRWQHHQLQLLSHPSLDILLVDRHQHPIPHKQGVGLARKLGCDLAASLIHQGIIESSWIHSSDADAELPEDYFQTDALDHNYAAATYSFDHKRGGDPVAIATQLYQQTLWDYVNGLESAGSPYAFHTIGSIIAVNYAHYCQARGFPKRAGGEDFYLLNKLRKLGRVAQLPALITLTPRLSHRVPFGTGPATAKILESLENNQPITTYDPILFERLGQCLNIIELAIRQQQPPADACLQLPSETRAALEQLGVNKCFSHLEQSRDAKMKLQHFHDWMDAFRTLKFVRLLQANHYPNIPLPTESQPH